MLRSSPKQRPLTIYCLDYRISNLPQAIRKAINKPTEGEEHSLSLGEGVQARLFIPLPEERPPAWSELFEGVIEEDLRRTLRNKSCRALLLIELSGHVFAVTFGHARHLIDYGFVKRSFGLRVVVNSVPHDKLHSIDLKHFERLSMHTKRISSSEEHLQSFGLDWRQDILRAVAGSPSDQSFAVRAAGADALVLSARYTLQDIPKILTKCLSYYDDLTYKETPFSYIDWFQPETDIETIEELDLDMCRTLIRGPSLAHEMPFLLTDEVVDSEHSGRVFIPDLSGKSCYREIDFDKIRAVLLQKSQTDKECLQLLRRSRIEIAEDGSDKFTAVSSLYDLLTWEHTQDIQDYILLSGTWIRISKDHADRIRTYIREEIPPPSTPLPQTSKHRKEDDFIAEVCDADLNMLSMQGLTHRGASMNHAIELCDILGSDKTLYCIKSGNKSKLLNHLFRQGYGAAISLLNDKPYLSGCSDLIKKAAERSDRGDLTDDYQTLISNPFNPEQHEICFCILKPKTKRWPDCIPYLAQLTLYDAALQLRIRGFRVSLQCVDVPVSAKKPKTDPPRIRSGQPSIELTSPPCATHTPSPTSCDLGS